MLMRCARCAGCLTIESEDQAALVQHGHPSPPGEGGLARRQPSEAGWGDASATKKFSWGDISPPGRHSASKTRVTALVATLPSRGGMTPPEWPTCCLTIESEVRDARNHCHGPQKGVSPAKNTE